MFKDNPMDRKNWNKQKESSFDQLKSLKNNILQMHRQIDNRNLDAIQRFLYFNYEDITASQLRNVYNLVLKIGENDYSQLSSKRVQIAYIAGRTDKRKTGMYSLLNFLDELFVEGATDKEKYKAVKVFTEATVAYHKYYESLGIKPK